ncbi:MAG: hypothetical protein J5789_06140 [Oscillospiraceae bacterium]|nr:hypothetical protein [Oscillospiraceae bacterium]
MRDNFFHFSNFDVKICQHLPEAILCEAAGVAEVAALGFPVLEAAVVEGFQIVRDDEGDDAKSQTFLKAQKAAYGITLERCISCFAA